MTEHISKINHRLDKHEWRLNDHQKEIDAIQARQEHMSKTLDEISKFLSHIRVAAITTAVIILASEVGIIEAIKKVI